jgi:hypothetical protein
MFLMSVLARSAVSSERPAVALAIAQHFQRPEPPLKIHRGGVGDEVLLADDFIDEYEAE